MTARLRIRPVPQVASVTPYRRPMPETPVDLDLSGTEGWQPAWVPPQDARYPDARTVEQQLAERYDTSPERVLVTAGADGALSALFRALLAPGRHVVLTTPTFEMLPRYAALSGAEVSAVRWRAGPLPVAAIQRAITPETALVVIVTPNNPTGAVATTTDLLAVADALPDGLLAVDLAYVDFADVDPTPGLLARDNVAVIRTFSKGWGLPGVRVGWLLANAEVVEWIRRVDNPYPVAAASLAVVSTALRRDGSERAAAIDRVRKTRELLRTTFEALDWSPLGSQGNFVAITPRNPRWVHDAFRGVGIGTRLLATTDRDLVRITAPADDETVARVVSAALTIGRPDALLFDMDGVLADVTASYRTAIAATAARFGVTVTSDDIAAAKVRGNASDDWALTRDLMAARGVTVALDDVITEFECLYQGSAGVPGLRHRERLIPSPDLLESLAHRWPLAVVTARPRADAIRFLVEQQVNEYFRCIVAREDAAAKPSPAPIHFALQQLRARRAWFFGDTVDDIRAARAAGVLPIGMSVSDATSGTTTALLTAGAARVLTSFTELGGLLP